MEKRAVTRTGTERIRRSRITYGSLDPMEAWGILV